MKVITRGVERPILFSAPMVLAVVEGRKTQTRRIIKAIPQTASKIWHDGGEWIIENEACNTWNGKLKCPYGNPGDLLWVRETWLFDPLPGFAGEGAYHYRATSKPAIKESFETRWRPSIHMPRRASRLTLEITHIRAERLLAVTEADAIAEGVETWPDGNYKAYGKHAGKHSTGRGSYLDLWDSINPENPANTNPWVWVITFIKK